VEDQNLYLPFLLKWNDPSLFPADLLLTQGFARESAVWALLAVLGRVVSLEAVFLGAYLAASYATLFFVHRLARAWWDDGAAAFVYNQAQHALRRGIGKNQRSASRECRGHDGRCAPEAICPRVQG